MLRCVAFDWPPTIDTDAEKAALPDIAGVR